ncbi:MAG: redoxin domain-containing protein [Oscillospiraceae bacterium]
MNQFKKFLAVLLVLTLMLSAFSACGKKEVTAVTEPAPIQSQESAETQAPAEQAVSAGFYQIGDKIEDFTVTTYDGKEVSLYEVLEQKNMVLLNLWASWCGPCGAEFPAMQEAYEQYQDKVEIIALSTESTDTDEVLAKYAQEKGMTFCVARDTAGVDARFDHMYIPCSVVVDRFGTICLMEEGGVPDPAVFANLFELYTGEDYTESLFPTSILAEMPTVQPADPEALTKALNGEGGTLEFNNSSNPFHWPMTVVQKDGRTVVAASNVNSYLSKAVVETQADVKFGDVLVLEYKLDNAISNGVMCLEVDGKCVKESTMSRNWGTYAYQFEEAGNHQIRICFDISGIDEEGKTNLWIDSIRVVSGDEAAKALENNPKYPVGEQIQLQLLNEDVKYGCLYSEAAPDMKDLVYFCTDPTLRLLVTLDESVDPETVYLEDTKRTKYFVASCATEEGYVVEIPNCNPEDLMGGATLYCDDVGCAGIIVFLSEDQMNRIVDMISENDGVSYKWEYTDEPVNMQIISGDVTYTVTYVDQNGDPVPGVMCQVCDENTCQVFTSDADGVCQFTLPAKAYEIHTLKVPAGYEGDTTTITNAPAQGGELTFTLTKR